MTLGFVREGFVPLLAVEKDEWAAKTYKRNFGAHVLDRPIEDVDGFPSADLVVGGPPCQGFSPLGRDGDRKSKMQLNQLWNEFVRVVIEVRPKMFLIENVPQFLRSDQYKAFREACGSKLDDYEVDETVLNAAHFGIPQTRKRGFVIGSRVGLPKWPVPTHGEGLFTEPFVTVRDSIGDLPLEPTNDEMHWSRNPHEVSLRRYEVIPEGGNRFDLARRRPDLLPDCWRKKKSGSTDVFGRLWWDRPACTIRTEFYKPEKGRYLHPEANRPITHREAARLQSFTDDFVFEGSRTQIARQIGNAVPPDLGRVLALQVRRQLESPVR